MIPHEKCRVLIQIRINTFANICIAQGDAAKHGFEHSVLSCSCPDDHYSAVPGRFASTACASPPICKVQPHSRCDQQHAKSILRGCVTHSARAMASGCLREQQEDADFAKNSTIYLQVKHDSIDFTGVIAVVDHFSRLSTMLSFDRIFYMHDTMFIHNRSAFVRSLEYYSQVRTCSLQMGQSMNIGIYSVRDLVRSGSTLRTLRGRDHSTVEERLKLKKGYSRIEGILFGETVRGRVIPSAAAN